MVGLILALFPHATLVHCRRDLRDVAISCWLTHFDNVPWTHSFAHIAANFADYQRVMQHWQRLVPDRILDIDYERLVSHQEQVSRRMIATCGLEWESGCLDFHTNRRPIRTANETLVRRPISDRSVGRHEPYRPFVPGLFDRISEIELGE